MAAAAAQRRRVARGGRGRGARRAGDEGLAARRRRRRAAAAPARGDGRAAAADAEASLPVRNAIGLHARPAARFVETVRGFDAEVRVAKAGGGAPVRRRASRTWWRSGRGSATRWSSARRGRRRARRSRRSGAGRRGVRRRRRCRGATAGPTAGRRRRASVRRSAARAAAAPAPGDGAARRPGVRRGSRSGRHGCFGRHARGRPPDRDPEGAGARARTARGGIASRDARRSSRTARRSRRAPARPRRRSSTPTSCCSTTRRCSSRRTRAIDAGATAERAFYDAAAAGRRALPRAREPLLQERAADVARRRAPGGGRAHGEPTAGRPRGHRRSPAS